MTNARPGLSRSHTVRGISLHEARASSKTIVRGTTITGASFATIAVDERIHSANLQRRKFPVQGGGSCIYCGSDGGARRFARRAHRSLTRSAAMPCFWVRAAQPAREITSYLDGYLAKAIYGDLRVHSGVQSRRGHPERLPALVAIEGRERTLNFHEPGSQPSFY